MKAIFAKIKKVFKYMINSDYRFVIKAYNGKYKDMDDKQYLDKLFKGSMGYSMNFENPKTFNEKMQWLKLYDRNSKYTEMVDKNMAKKYVGNIIGDKYLVQTYGVWDNFDDIDFNLLPEQFVLKCTHDSGGVVVCRDKSKFNKEVAKKIINSSLENNFYYALREWPYKNVEPKIIAEKYLSNEESVDAGLVDYKFFCFNGESKFIYISRGLENHKTACISFYDLNGKELPFHRSDYKQMGEIILPENYGEMKQIAGTLAGAINAPFVRIDLYSVNSKVYFSEITFTPCGGFLPFEPKSVDSDIGNLLVINNDDWQGSVFPE